MSESGTTDVNDEQVRLRVVFNKVNYDIEMPLDATVQQLKAELEQKTKVPAALQKLMYKGMMKNEDTLRKLQLKNDTKLLLVGSTVEQVIQVATPVVAAAPVAAVEEEAPSTKLADQREHKKIIDKGVPEDAIKGFTDRHEGLPSTRVLTGLYNKRGDKVRLTFKNDIDQLWIATQTHTEKIPYIQIKDIKSEAIPSHPGYHIMSLQLGNSEVSKYWLYFVPAQYVRAIRNTILGFSF